MLITAIKVVGSVLAILLLAGAAVRYGDPNPAPETQQSIQGNEGFFESLRLFSDLAERARQRPQVKRQERTNFPITNLNFSETSFTTRQISAPEPRGIPNPTPRSLPVVTPQPMQTIIGPPPPPADAELDELENALEKLDLDFGDVFGDEINF